MDHFGFLSIIPPIIAIALAIFTKQVILSLFVGVIVGLGIYTGSIGGTFVEFTEVLVGNLMDDWQARVLLFTALLGCLVGLVYRSGGSLAFGESAIKTVKTRKSAQVAAWFMGILIFFDDYFNTLTVGSVMRPVTDKFKISREKLAYIIDSTAAPVCIIIPISTWVAYVISLIIAEFDRAGQSVSGFDMYLQAIPYNFYALLALIAVFVLAVSDLEFGPMAKAEKRALTSGNVYDLETQDDIPGGDITDMEISSKGTVSDLLLPILTLIVATIVGILYTGGYFEGVGFIDAVGDADAATALIYGTVLANLVAIAWYSSRKILTLSESMNAFIQGAKSMIPALAILLLAWSIGGVSDMLGTGAYVAEVVSAALPAWTIPAVIFVVSAFMAFATGTSWGTFAIMMPIGIPLIFAVGGNIPAAIAAVLAGGIFGDHCSPISDTTVLSSTGASCNHIDHVKTQLPYALLIAGISIIGFLITGFVASPVVPLVVTLALLVGAFYVLHARGEVVEADKLRKTKIS